MASRSYPLGLSLLGILLLLILACSSDPRGTDWYFGNTLITRVTDVRRAEEVRFTDEDKHYVIRPIQEGRQLAVVKMEVRTQEANVVFLSIGKESITLRDEDDLEYQLIDFVERREEVSETHPRENVFSPFLWGDVELPSRCGQPVEPCQLVGWVIFEVPRDINTKLVLWEAADTIYVRF